jgi:hypothetical protein
MRSSVATLAALVLLTALAAGGLLAAPRARPLPPEFEPVTVGGRWDGDAQYQPWLRDDDGAIWCLAFPGRGAQDAMLGPIDSTAHVRVTGYAATGGRTRFLYVTT